MGKSSWQGPVLETNGSSALFPGSKVTSFPRLLLRNPSQASFVNPHGPTPKTYINDAWMKETQVPSVQTSKSASSSADGLGATGNSCHTLRRMGTRASRRCWPAVILTAVNPLWAGRQQPGTAGTAMFHYMQRRSHPNHPAKAAGRMVISAC